MTGCSVNDSGQIIGLGVDSNGNYHGYWANPTRGGWDSDEVSAPMRLPESVREQVRRQMGFVRFGSRMAAQ